MRIAVDANMVRSGLSELPLPKMDVLIIANVGNLVCPAEFEVGEDARRWSTPSPRAKRSP